nr:hypothetical protein CFP56_03373 [Quercus suber]
MLSHVRDSLRQVNDSSWIIGGKLLLTRYAQDKQIHADELIPTWSAGPESYFMITEPRHLPAPQTPQPEIPFVKVYDAGDAHVCWKIGDAFLKLIEIDDPGVTPEHVTIRYLETLKLNFTIPKVHYHGEWDDRYYLILSQVPGQTLMKAWPLMSEELKQYYVDQVTDACKTLAAVQSKSMGGVDGKYLPENYLTTELIDGEVEYETKVLEKNCKDLGMDCTSFVFYHCDLGPGNIIVDLSTRSLGIIDWECAGFVPRQWIRTKFRLCAGMDLDDPGFTHEWRLRMKIRLGEEGFTDVATTWMRWSGLV